MERLPKTETIADISVGMIGLGCAKNLVDGEVMLGHLLRNGVSLTSDPTQADVVIVNTCGFITDAKRESLEEILEVAEAKRQGQVKRLVVAGCMVQVYAEEMKREIPEIDAFVGLDQLEAIVEAVRGEKDGSLPDQHGAVRLYDYQQPRVLSTQGYAFLKVAEGCDNPCSFCHIPAMRGSYRSRRMGDLIADARRLEAAGVKELILIAQDTTRFGEDLGLGREGLRRLVEGILEATSIPWVRFLYAYPATLDEGLFDLMASEDRFLSYLDIPLQHADRKVLKAMKRGGDAGSFRKMIDRARTTVPDLTLRTTFIVGFPGEGEGEFRTLEEFVEDLRFDHLGVFTYSWQEENPGFELGDPVSESLKKERMERLMEIQQPISMALNEGLVGRRFPALIEGPLEEMELLTAARLPRQAPEIDGRLLINDGTAPAGSLVEVEITEAHPYDLVGMLHHVIDSAPEKQTLPVLG
jgi:ribosomal protein S12 methylthiotransferase